MQALRKVTVRSIMMVATIVTSLTCNAQTFLDRLPPLEDRLALLPAVETENYENDVVMFAASAVELKVPLRWQVREVALESEMRLVLSPRDAQGPPASPFDGVWVTYHLMSEDIVPTPHELWDLVTTRLLGHVSGHASYSTPLSFTHQGYKGVRQDFVASSRNGQTRSQGTHMLISTRWGMCEIHVESSDDQRPPCVDVDDLLAGLTLNAPESPQETPSQEAAAAKRAFGTWKASGHRLKLYGDGLVVVLQDEILNRTLEERPTSEELQQYRKMGQYVASDDVLLITWDNGTKQDLRWLRLGNELLLTDSDGQKTLLKKIYE